MRFIFKLFGIVFKIAGIAAGLAALAGVVLSLSSESENKRYVLDVDFDGDCEE